jgi:hypothetical protein
MTPISHSCFCPLLFFLVELCLLAHWPPYLSAVVLQLMQSAAANSLVQTHGITYRSSSFERSVTLSLIVTTYWPGMIRGSNVRAAAMHAHSDNSAAQIVKQASIWYMKA